MLTTRRDQFIVILAAVVLAALLITGAIVGGNDSNANPVTQSASSSTLSVDAKRKMELTSIRADGTEYCVSFAATGKRPQKVKLENCGPTAVNLTYDGLDRTLDVGEKKTIDLGYDYTEFSVAIEALDGEYISGFQP